LPAAPFLSHLAPLRDPRQVSKVLYPSTEVLLLLLYATICGTDDLVGIELWGDPHWAFLCRFLPFARQKTAAAAHCLGLAARQRLVLGQEAVAAKSNEITAIPRLLQRLALTGALVTIDAMATQKPVARTILEGGGDYVLALTENRPATHAAVAEFFAAPPRRRSSTAIRALMAITAGSRPAAMPSALRSPG
jgi:hypothetical protein